MKKIRIINGLLTLTVFACCNNEISVSDEKKPEVKTPVSITMVSNQPVSELINLNATSFYLKKNIVRSNAGGYIQKVFINTGESVIEGEVLFSIKTKEADALGRQNSADTLFSFKGEIKVLAPSSGIVTEINHQQSDYLSDGDQLAVIAAQSSFVFLLNVPFELNKYAATGMTCSLLLPDSTSFNGTIVSKLSSVDSAAQTQSFIIRPITKIILPEGLVASVQLHKNAKANAQVIDKSAVLSDETLEKFWVMKLINDSTAVKTPVAKGITTDDKIEILTPQFKKGERFVSLGNYGLPDTAFITIIH